MADPIVRRSAPRARVRRWRRLVRTNIAPAADSRIADLRRGRSAQHTTTIRFSASPSDAGIDRYAVLIDLERFENAWEAEKQEDNAPAPARAQGRQAREGWEVRDPRGELVCVTVYKRGAVEVVRRLAA